MGVVIFAAFCSVLALLTGIICIGSGKNFQFKNREILKGKRNAILYIWITFSTLFSLVHTTANVGYAIDPKWGLSSGIQFWFVLHATTGLLLTAAHLYIFRVLESDTGDQYLWGKNRV